MAARVAIDLMGGDSPPYVIFEAVLACSQQLQKGDSLVAIVHPSCLHDLQARFSRLPQSIEFISASETVEMEDSPLFVVRRKKNSSMAEGMRLLKDKQIDALVSTGNTGALVAFAALHLPLLPGVERPALLVMMPTEQGNVAVLDVGAHINPTAQQLASYALLGTLYRECLFGDQYPKIGLLNIGSEEQKGTKEIKDTYQLLQQTFPDTFVGNVEGRDVFQGKIDVLVTDGFTGNVFLKTSEGISSFLAEYLQKHFSVPEIVSHLHQQFNYSEHPGAFLCGVEGVVVKCHGFSDKNALINGIRGAFDLVHKNILSNLKQKLQDRK